MILFYQCSVIVTSQTGAKQCAKPTLIGNTAFPSRVSHFFAPVCGITVASQTLFVVFACSQITYLANSRLHNLWTHEVESVVCDLLKSEILVMCFRYFVSFSCPKQVSWHYLNNMAIKRPSRSKTAIKYWNVLWNVRMFRIWHELIGFGLHFNWILILFQKFRRTAASIKNREVRMSML